VNPDFWIFRGAHEAKKLNAGRGAVGKTAVVGMKDRTTDEVKAEVVENTKQPTLQGFVKGNAADGAEIYTDENRAYEGLDNHLSNYAHWNCWLQYPMTLAIKVTTTEQQKRKRMKLPPSRPEVKVKPNSYQPSKDELAEEIQIPITLEELVKMAFAQGKVEDERGAWPQLNPLKIW